MTRKCHNLKPQTIQWHQEEETQNIDGHINQQQKSHCALDKKQLKPSGGGGA